MYIYIVIVPCWCVNSRIWSLSFSCLPQSRCHMSVCSRIDSPLFFPKCAHMQRKSDKFPWQTHGTRRAILHLETHLIHMVFLLSRTSVQKVWSPDPAAPVSPWNYCIRVDPCNGCPDGGHVLKCENEGSRPCSQNFWLRRSPVGPQNFPTKFLGDSGAARAGTSVWE